MTTEFRPYEDRYTSVWQQTQAAGELTADAVASSKYYFDFDPTTGAPIPKEFNTFGVIGLIQMAADTQRVLTQAWNRTQELLGHPLAYAVEPALRHVELILFLRPEQQFPPAVIQRSIDSSYERLRVDPPRMFKTVFRSPFMTPDGSIVVPGYPDPEDAIDGFRRSVRTAVGDANMPEKQSQWFHISLGRVLEPVSSEQLAPVLDDMREHWGEVLAEMVLEKIMWMHERQWYMLQKTVLHELALAPAV